MKKLKNDLSHTAASIQWLTSCHKKCYGMMLHKILTCMYNIILTCMYNIILTCMYNIILTCMYNIILTCMYNIIMSSAPFFAYPTENFHLQAQSGGLIALLQKSSLI